MTEQQERERDKECVYMLSMIGGFIEDLLPNPSEATTYDGVELLRLRYEAVLAENKALKKQIQILTLSEETDDDE